MSGFITQNQNDMTWLQAQDDVAASLGNAGEANSRALAAACLKDVIRDMNAAREWTWLQRSTTGNVTTDGLITLPSRAKKIYDLVVANITLQPASQRDRDRLVNPNTGVGGTRYYTDYNTAESNKLEVFDHPTTTAAYTLRYLSLITLSYADADVVDVPESVMGYILARARADYVARVDGTSPKLAVFQAQANERWRRIVRDDTDSKPDEEIVMLPGHLWPGAPLTNVDPDYWY